MGELGRLLGRACVDELSDEVARVVSEPRNVVTFVGAATVRSMARRWGWPPPFMDGGSQATPLAGRSGADGQQLEGGLDRAEAERARARVVLGAQDQPHGDRGAAVGDRLPLR